MEKTRESEEKRGKAVVRKVQPAPPIKKTLPTHGAQKKRINRIRGQIDGIERMIDGQRYCIDIVTQIKAVKSALQSLEAAIIETHLRGCVRVAFNSQNAFEVEEKIKEIMSTIS